MCPKKLQQTRQSQKPRQHVLTSRTVLEKFKDARVHYAVLKQRTNPPDNPCAPLPASWRVYPRPSDPYPPETPTHPPRTREPAGCLRTQQCARQATHPRPATFQPAPPPEGDTHRRTSSHPSRETLRQCSTHEQPPQTRTAWAWPLPPAPTRRQATPAMQGLMETSSLERR